MIVRLLGITIHTIFSRAENFHKFQEAGFFHWYPSQKSLIIIIMAQTTKRRGRKKISIPSSTQFHHRQQQTPIQPAMLADIYRVVYQNPFQFFSLSKWTRQISLPVQEEVFFRKIFPLSPLHVSRKGTFSTPLSIKIPNISIKLSPRCSSRSRSSGT